MKAYPGMLTVRHAGRSGLLLAAALLLLAGWALTGGAPEALGEEDGWAKVTLLYHADCKGKIEPCG